MPRKKDEIEVNKKKQQFEKEKNNDSCTENENKEKKDKEILKKIQENKVKDKKKDDDEKQKKEFDGPLIVNIANIEDQLFDTLQGLIGESILIVTESDQLNLFGQTFRPIFCGTIFSVTQGAVTLFPVNIKMVNAPFFEFPTPLSVPLEKIAHFTPNFDCNQRIPLN